MGRAPLFEFVWSSNGACPKKKELTFYYSLCISKEIFIYLQTLMSKY